MSGANQIFFTRTGPATMDPRLKHYEQLGKIGGATAPRFHSANAGEIPVIARVNDLQLWKALSEVRPGAEIQKGTSEWIVTARIPLRRVEHIRRQHFVNSLKAAQRVRSALDATINEMGLNNPHKEVLKQGGEGTVIGIVDFGGDFHHDNFRHSDGSTRITHLWDQRDSGVVTSSYGYGQTFTSNQIDEALKASDPYKRLGYPVGYGYLNQGTHGTHVMDIAGGNQGVAPKADLMFVELSRKPETTIESDFTDSVRLLEAVDFIFKQAGNKPCVVNLSLGTNGGPHDGTGLVEQGFDALVSQQKNRAIVIAAANSRTDKSHKSGMVPQDGIIDLKWVISPFDSTSNEVEIWYSGQDEFGLEIIDPRNVYISEISLGDNGNLWARVQGQPRVVGFISHRKHDPNNGDNVIHIFQNPDLDDSGGEWTLRLRGKQISDNGIFHAWIERDDPGPTEFSNDDPAYTIGSISTGKKSIVVGSFDAHKPSMPISYFSSQGPTRDQRQKPEVSAAGHAVWAARSRTGNGTIAKSGTSMAAPAVTGLVARIFGVAQEQRKDLSIDETRKILIETSKRNPPASGSEGKWNPLYGYGRVNGEALEHPLLTPLSSIELSGAGLHQAPQKRSKKG